MRKNWLTTAGGIMALFGGIPIALGTAGVKMPNWFYIVCISFSVIGPGIGLIAAKGQDEHSTVAQVEQATSGASNPPVPPEPPMPPGGGPVQQPQVGNQGQLIKQPPNPGGPGRPQ